MEISSGRNSKEVIIADDDVRLLRLLAPRNITVRLECHGLCAYHMRLHQLLKRLTPGLYKNTWRVKVSVTGSLRGKNHTEEHLS